MRAAVGIILAAVVLALPGGAGRTETVQLRDGTLIQGELIIETSRYVVVRRRSRTEIRIDRRLIAHIYKEGEEVEPLPPPGPRSAPSGNPILRGRKRWPEPFPTIPVGRDDRIAAAVTRILAGRDDRERAARRAAVAPADAALIPPIETLRRWLARPRAYPAAEGAPAKIDLPWQGGNPRAIAVIGVPKGYDPLRGGWPVVLALHGTEDKPDASVGNTRGVLDHGCFLVAPRTLDPRHLWYHPEEWRNLRRILGHLAGRYRIDPRRIVCSGGSGGGMGTWGLAAMHPELFCAAASSAGMPPIDPSDVVRLRGVPFFILHGRKDHIPVAGPRRMVEAMTRLHIEHVYVEHDGDHFPSAELIKRMREWVQKAPPKKHRSPRPAVLAFIAEADQAGPLPAPPGGEARTKPAPAPTRPSR